MCKKYIGGSKGMVTRALTGVHIARANGIPYLGTTDNHKNQTLPVHGASSAVKLQNLR